MIAPLSKKAPRLLHLVLSLSPGGAERTVIDMCRRSQLFADTAVCCLDDEGAWAPIVRERGIKVIALKRQPGFRPDLALRIATITRELGSEVIHCHQYSPFVYGRLAMLRNPAVRLVYTEQGRSNDAAPSRKRRLVNPLISRFNGAIVAVSDELRQYMVTAGFPAGRVEVIYNGVDPGQVPSAAARQRARQLAGLDEGAFVVATVARLDPVRDLHTLLDAFAQVRQALPPEARLLVVGDGPERASLESRAARPDLAGAVVFLGMRSDVNALLPAADLFVNCSISEGVSLTILEAMAAGVPVIGTNVGGTPEVLAAGAAGELVPARNATRLGEAIRALAADPSRRTALAVAGRYRLESTFTVDRMVASYARLYERVLQTD